jgi:hypothetical protein
MVDAARVEYNSAGKRNGSVLPKRWCNPVSVVCSRLCLKLDFARRLITHSNAGAQYASRCAANIIAYRNPTLYRIGGIITVTTITDIMLETITTSNQYLYTFTAPMQCDGRTRLSISADFDDTVIHTLATPITQTFLAETYALTIYSTINIPSPTCTINPSDCQNLVSVFTSGRASADKSWDLANIVTMSLASPPNYVVVNDITTAITHEPNSPYTLTIHSTTYRPILPEEPAYLISDADIVTPYNKILTPGGQLTATWLDGSGAWEFDLPCQLPTNNTPSCTASACVVIADFVQLMYFAPPPTSRDLCASTSSDYNRCSWPLHFMSLRSLTSNH